jgi:hypothetical protein
MRSKRLSNTKNFSFSCISNSNTITLGVPKITIRILYGILHYLKENTTVMEIKLMKMDTVMSMMIRVMRNSKHHESFL